MYICPKCGHAAKDRKPVTCPVCRQDGEAFATVKPDELEAAARAQGGVEEKKSFDGIQIRWSKAAQKAVKGVQNVEDRRHARLRIEKAARLANLPVVTLEFSLRQLAEASKPETPSEESTPPTSAG